MRAIVRAAAACLVLALAGARPTVVDAQGSVQGNAPPPASNPAADTLRVASTWAYQLQNVDVAKLARSTWDVLVLDPGAGPRTGLSAADVRRLQKKPDGRRRLVLAYINIGEAEDYRSYWNPAWTKTPPEWLGASNQHWKGDHRVRHWHAGWQALVLGDKNSMLGRLIAFGYDGAYLDRVDVYQFWCGERPSAFTDMVAFVEAMSRWAKAQKPGFLIVPQNGEEFLADARYRAAIDGLGKEDLYFGDRGNDTRNYDTRIELAEQLMGHGHAAGLPVLAIEYARQPDNQRFAAERHGKLGHKLYFGPRSLAYIGQSGPAHPEDKDTEPYLAARGATGCPGDGR